MNFMSSLPILVAAAAAGVYIITTNGNPAKDSISKGQLSKRPASRKGLARERGTRTPGAGPALMPGYRAYWVGLVV
jgi:hypothetical protein